MKDFKFGFKLAAGFFAFAVAVTVADSLLRKAGK